MEREKKFPLFSLRGTGISAKCCESNSSNRGSSDNFCQSRRGVGGGSVLSWTKAVRGVIPTGAVLKAKGGIWLSPIRHFTGRKIPRPAGENAGLRDDFPPKKQKSSELSLAALWLIPSPSTSPKSAANYWFSGLKVRIVASEVEQTPAGSTRTTASSSAQNARIPVWLMVSGTPTTV